MFVPWVDRRGAWRLSSSMSFVHNFSLTSIVLHQRSFMYRHTPPPRDLPVVAAIRSMRKGAPKPSNAMPASESASPSHVSVRARIHASLNSCWYWTWACTSSDLFRRDCMLARMIEGKGTRDSDRLAHSRNPPLLPRFLDL